MKKIITLILATVMLMACAVPALAQDLPIIPIGPTVEIKGLSLVLDGEIGLVFHIEVPEYYQTGYALLTCKGDDGETRVLLADCPRDNLERFTVTYPLSAVQLSEPVSIAVYSERGVLLAQKSKSAEDYVALMIAEGTGTAKEIAVAKALINYGHYAQLACAEYCGWTIGEDFAQTAAYAAPTASGDIFDDYAPNRALTEEYGIKYQLSLEYKTDLVLYIKASQCPTVTVNGETVKNLIPAGGGTYKLTVPGINVLNLGDSYDITVNGTAFTASAFTYGALAMDCASENTRLALLSMYEFYAATCAYHAK